MARCETDKADINKGLEVTGGLNDRDFRVDRVDDAVCNGMDFY